MSSVLINLAMVLGFFLCIFSLGVGLIRNVSFWTVMFRSAIVLSVGTVIVMTFFRYFNLVLYRFLGEKLKEHRKQMEEEELGEEVIEE
jgi:hypothetical protein